MNVFLLYRETEREVFYFIYSVRNLQKKLFAHTKTYSNLPEKICIFFSVFLLERYI